MLKLDIDWEGGSFWDRSKRCLYNDVITEELLLSSEGEQGHITVHPDLSRDVIALITVINLEHVITKEALTQLVRTNYVKAENMGRIEIGDVNFFYHITTQTYGVEVNFGDRYAMVGNVGHSAESGIDLEGLLESFKKKSVFNISYHFLTQGTTSLSVEASVHANSYRQLLATYNVSEPNKNKPLLVKEPHTLSEIAAKNGRGMHIQVRGNVIRFMKFEDACDVIGVHVTQPVFREYLQKNQVTDQGWATFDYWHLLYKAWSDDSWERTRRNEG